jgi:hypothetical protein
MKTLNRTGRLVAALALVACTALPLDAAGPKTRYERVLAQASTLKLSRRPSPLSQIRKVVAAYEVLARQHPTSYSRRRSCRWPRIASTDRRWIASRLHACWCG